MTTQHLSAEAVQRVLEEAPDYVKGALAEKAVELECPIEAVVEMANTPWSEASASFLDEEAFSFEDCLLAQRSQS